jgi:ATP-dependent Clp protease ATP-binding subunit ClpA
MPKRLTPDARKSVLNAASEEAHRRGDRRIGTDHMLLGLLHEPAAAKLLGVGLEDARRASSNLDRAALAAIGFEANDLDEPLPLRSRRRPPFTSGARDVLVRSVNEARAVKARHIEARHLLLGILTRERPDPAAELLAALEIDVADARERLRRSAT